MHIYPVSFFATQHAVNPRLCFVIMPFTASWSNRTFAKVKAIVEGAGYDCKRADDYYGRVVLGDIWQKLNEAAFVIADLTDANPNVFYELGLAHALGKEIIPLLQEGQSIPFDQNPFRILFYEDNSDGYQVLDARLPDWMASLRFDSAPEMILRQGRVADFNAWRKVNTLRSLRGENFSAIALPEVDLHDAVLGESDLSHADLSRANLSHSVLIRCHLEDATLVSADLTHVNLSEARMVGADLSGAILRRAILLRPDLSGASLVGADVDGMTIDYASHERFKKILKMARNYEQLVVER